MVLVYRYLQDILATNIKERRKVLKKHSEALEFGGIKLGIFKSMYLAIFYFHHSNAAGLSLDIYVA